MSDHRGPTPGRGRARATRVIGALAIGVVTASLTGCGIPTDAKARPIDREALPSQLVSVPTTAAPPAPSPLSQTVNLYLVGMAPNGGEELVRMSAEIANVVDPNDLPRQVIEQLIAQQPTDGTGNSGSLTNAIPTTVRVLNASVDGDVLDLDLSDLGTVELTRQRLAAAQIVFTATDLPGINKVRFSINGQPSAVPLATESSTPGQEITRDDYSSLLKGT
jgi:spore germination protein GerM